MQSLSRALFSLRGACSSSGRIASRAFSEAAADAAPAATGAFSLSSTPFSPSKLISNLLLSIAAAEEAFEGAKSKLHRLLVAADKPLTAAEVWARAQEEGLRSKRFTKQMLQQMKGRGHVQTVALGTSGTGKHRSSNYGYLLAGGPAAEAHLAAREAAQATQVVAKKKR
jgi:hypothetical protein